METKSEITEILNCIKEIHNRELTLELLKRLSKNNYSYKIKMGYGNVYRIFCFIKKSREFMIINTIGKNLSPFSIQIRIANIKTFENIPSFSENIRLQLLDSKKCGKEFCCNCGKEYTFTFSDQVYKKCHMLCDNFTFTNIKKDDIETIIGIISNEIE